MPRGERLLPPRGPGRPGAGPEGGAAVRRAAHRAQGGGDRRGGEEGARSGGLGRVRGQPPDGCGRRLGCLARRDRGTCSETRRGAEMTDNKVIVISGSEPGLPYSKGLRASELMVTGLSPYRAYQVAEQVVAEQVEERLRERRVASVTAEELDDLTIDVLTDVAGERYATNFLRWR